MSNQEKEKLEEGLKTLLLKIMPNELQLYSF